MSGTIRFEPESEQAYVGSLIRLLNDGEFDLANQAASLIEPDDFHVAPLRSVFKACKGMIQRGEQFDHRLLLSELNGTIQNPAAVIYEACQSVNTAAPVEGYAKAIRRAAEQRRAVCLLQDTLNDLRKTTDPTSTIMKLRASLDKITPLKKSKPIPVEAYKPFPIDVLPAVVRDFVCATSDAIGCDPAFVAIPLLACLARAIGNKRVIRLKRSWHEPAIIWAAIVGKSGTHKTPAIMAAMHFLQRKQSESIAQHAEALEQYEEDKAVYERDYSAWKRSKKAQTEPPPWPPQVPVCERYITTDTTIEALAALLANQFDGLLTIRDELAGWLGGIAEYKRGKKGSDLGHWLASWSAAPLTVDRKTGDVKMLHVPRAAVSIVGGIQPGVLRKAIGQEHLEDGLCARLLLAMPDPKAVKWTDASVDPSTEAAMSNIFNRLLDMTPGADGDGNPEPYPMPLTPQAKAAWIEYYDRHRAELADLDDDLAAAWSKLEAYAARFALIFQLCSWAAGEADENVVDEAAIMAGIALSEWFGGEARRVYGMFAESEVDRQNRELAELIRRRGDTITPRELMRSSRRYPTSSEAESALNDLVRSGRGRWEHLPSGPRGGKPTRAFRLVDTVDVDETS